MNEKASVDSEGPPKPLLVLITGLSGSGKSTAANALEDLGYYCVDNLPLPLLRTFFADPISLVGADHQRIAVVGDVRARGFADVIPQLILEIDRDQFDFVLFFLEASEDSLVRRFSETRRAHPLGSGDRPVLEGIRREQELLNEVRASADRILDTTNWTVHDVRNEIYREFATGPDHDERMVVSLVSFGFKYGTPTGTDLVFDARFLANPHFIPGLKEQTGCDTGVQEFLDKETEFGEFVDRIEDFLLFLLPRYRRENRAYVSIAIGCTGGRHRSVASAIRVSQRLRDQGWNVRLFHRDLNR